MKKITYLLFCVTAFSLGFLSGNNVQAQMNDNVFIVKGNSHVSANVNRSILAKGRESISSVIFSEGFESGPGTWMLNGDWAIGSPTNGPVGGYSSSNCAGTNLTGTYMASVNERMISSNITLPNTTSDIKFSFKEWYNMESGYDNGIVEVSTDGGSNWTSMGNRTGNSGNVWRTTEVTLNQFHGQTIQLAFHLTSDGSVQYEGWYIDNMEISVQSAKPLSAVMTNLNSQNFPFIYMNVSVDTNGVGCSALNQSNFTVYENGTLQTDHFSVTPPNTSGGVRRADIIFLMDNSGSMGPYQTSIANNVNDFVNNLVASNVDFALGLCRYGDSPNNGDPYIEDFGSLTSDATYFKNNVWTRNTVNGGTEPGYYAITQSLNSFNFRPGAQKILIEITDETPNQGGSTMNDALTACTNNSATVFALTDSTYLYNDFYPITSATHGQIYSVTRPFDDILNYISQSISNSYVVQYKTSDPAINGVLRNVEVRANYHSDADTARGSYTPGAAPSIVLTTATNALFNSASNDHVAIVISAQITDLVAPFLYQADLYYKNSNDTVYRMLQMTASSGNTYEAIIPSNQVSGPGIDFYITATDGQVTSSLPSVNPATNPFQFAVLPNVAPVITHNVISGWPVATPINVDAVVTDVTNYISGVVLFYRIYGQLIYTDTAMVLSNGSYKINIPASMNTSLGLEYYIKAKDNFGVSTMHGTPDAPHRIYDNTGIHELTSEGINSYAFPNPFRDKTQIVYSVNERSMVTLQILNLTGEVLATLVNTRVEPGSSTIEFSNKYLPAGVYYYTITVQSENTGVITRENKKLVLIK